jgi:hypothetical protein
MKLTREQTRTLAAAVGLDIPDADLENVTLRTSALLASMARMEAELGAEFTPGGARAWFATIRRA